MSNNFKIGEPVVCIKTHPSGVIKENETYTCVDLKLSSCNCALLIKIDKPMNFTKYQCRKCREIRDFDGYIDSGRFVPLDTLVNISELDDILNLNPDEKII